MGPPAPAVAPAVVRLRVGLGLVGLAPGGPEAERRVVATVQVLFHPGKGIAVRFVDPRPLHSGLSLTSGLSRAKEIRG